jgi:hypothetical protein
MAYVSILIAGYLLGIFSILILAALYLLHRPRYVAPTKHRRANRDKPLPVVQPPWEREEVGGIEYRFMGQTGEEV